MGDLLTGFPSQDFNPMAGQRPIGATFAVLDDLRERYPWFRSTAGPGFWVFTRYELVKSALLDPGLFSSQAIAVLESQQPRWIPETLDPPEHTTWRRLLSPYFSPARVATMERRIRTHCRVLIDRVADQGECEFVGDFATRFPTAVFLEMLGLDTSRLETFLSWNDAILHSPFRPGENGRRGAAEVMTEVGTFFADLIIQRRGAPGDDLISEAIAWQVDGDPVSDTDLVSMCTLLFLAGMDTMTAQLAYTFWHLATHPDDRQQIITDPDVLPTAVEEFLRTYPITSTGRVVTKDADFHGCPLREGDKVFVSMSAANRDPEIFADSTHVHLDRRPNPHLAFGGGAHRCLGSHLARLELQVALQEWHRRIPHYGLRKQAPAFEHAAQVLGPDTLPLDWTEP